MILPAPIFGPAHLPALVLRAAVACAVLLLVFASSSAGGPAGSPESRLLERALKLLPERPDVPIRFIDPELAPDADAIRRLDAFLVREPDGTIRQVIYLNRRSVPIEKALAGKALDIAIVAAIIRHEMEHLRGGGETQARQAERDFFQHLVFVGHVSANDGLAYLADLDQLYHLREGR